MDFSFEWIRADKIRLEYKKYLIRAQYESDNLTLAVDDCIFRFFLYYDEYIRKLFKEDIQEFEISALYETFFMQQDGDQEFNFENTLDKHKIKVPTFFDGTKRVNTNIITLREGLSEIIISDYKGVLNSRKEEAQQKEAKTAKVIKEREPEQSAEFSGAQLERMLKTYCFSKKIPTNKEIESAITQFLSSYFQFGKFYDYEQFKDVLIQGLAEYIYSGLIDKLKNGNPLELLKQNISTELKKFREINRIKKLDGLAWINDLKAVLSNYFTDFIDYLFDEKKTVVKIEPILTEDVKKESNEIDFSEIYDLDLEVEEFRIKLEELLKEKNISMVERMKIVRMKVQEFISDKRK